MSKGMGLLRIFSMNLLAVASNILFNTSPDGSFFILMAAVLMSNS
jgi:hypothetical protein